MDNLYLLPRALVDRLRPEPSRLRDRALVHAAPERIDSLVLIQHAGTLVLARDSSGAWSIRSPERDRADGSRVEGLLWDLKDLRARGFIEKPSPKNEKALDNPELCVVLGVAGGTTRLTFARLSPADSLACVRVEGETGLAVLDSLALGRLHPGLEDLRYRKILKLDTGAISRVRLEYPQSTIELVRKDTVWSIIRPEKAPAPGWKVQNMLWDLAGMDYAGVVAADGADSLSRGFGRPALRVSLFKADSLAACVAFGDSLPRGRVYLRRGGDPRTFSVDRKVLDGLPAKVEALKEEPEQTGVK
jgi:hypothetical protein